MPANGTLLMAEDEQTEVFFPSGAQARRRNHSGADCEGAGLAAYLAGQRGISRSGKVPHADIIDAGVKGVVHQA